MAVSLAVIFNVVAAAHDFARQIRVALDANAHAKKGGAHVACVQLRQYLRRHIGVGAVVDREGDLVPRDIITSFSCRYNGKEIFRADFFPAISANPYVSFFTIAKESGKLEFEWIGDNGFLSTASASITVE